MSHRKTWSVPVFLLLSACAAAADLTLDVDLDPASRRFDATAELVGPLEFAFTLHESLEVRRMSTQGHTVAGSGLFRGGAHRWHLKVIEGVTMTVEYGGTLPPLDSRIDHRGVLRELAPMASAAGTFLPAGSGWYPQPDKPFTYTVRLSLPGDQRGLVPGRLAAETLPTRDDERYTAQFEFAHPAEGIDLMAGPFVVRERRLVLNRSARRASAAPAVRAEPVEAPSSGLRLRTYFFRGMENLADGYLEDSARYIELYSQRIGTYAFDGFSVVASPLPTGFGMAGLTYIGAEVLKLPFIRATSLGHEVLHNWWGNGVYVDYARGNWSEGLTTFMADYFYKERESAAAARDMRHGWLRDFSAVPAHARRPLTAFRSRTHGAEAAVGYGKAAMLFFMLRETIGEDRFERGLRELWEKHRFRTAWWSDLRSAFEQASGRTLTPFFEQWLTRPGAPRVSVDSARARAAGDETMLDLALNQSSPAYALRLPIEIVYADRSEMRLVELGRERETVTLRVKDLPRGVRTDPEFRVWRELDRAELPPILRQWIVAAAPALAVVSADAASDAAAHAVAGALFERKPKASRLVSRGRETPLLIAGLHDDVDAALAKHRLPPRPAKLPRGSAQVWTIEQTRGAAPVAVLSARDAASLEAIARALPHYGSQSWLVFEGSKVIARGVWPAHSPLVPVTFER
ncbi:MAG TPA: M1 family aminopeptidase [Burkholderiales bacterium]|nr:M1 family aminopeptidase [Burkholderiales bacterium]